MKIGSFSDVKNANAGIPFGDGFPAYYQDARAFIVLIDPARQEFLPGTDTSGDGSARTSAACTSDARTWAASPTRARRTSGWNARATGRGTTGWARR